MANKVYNYQHIFYKNTDVIEFVHAGVLKSYETRLTVEENIEQPSAVSNI